MKKIKNLYIDDENKNAIIIVETEDGSLYKQEDIATGSCWMLYWVKQKEEKDIKELADLIMKVNKENNS